MHSAVTEHSIAEMVDTFYGKVRYDDLLGPIFAGAIGDNWGPHLDKMKAFWSSVFLASRTYKGNPMLAHLQLPRLTQRHFEHWLQLWEETACSLCSEEVAFQFVRRAQMIGDRLLYAIQMTYEADRSATIPQQPGAAAPLDNATA
jgi:hemoglobin